MQIEEEIRKLACSRYWQNIYNASQKINGIRLFSNESNFSGVQMLFLYWLETYHLLYQELAQMEWEQLSEDVIKNRILCDAFLYWRQLEIQGKLLEHKRLMQEYKTKSTQSTPSNMKQHSVYKGKQGIK